CRIPSCSRERCKDSVSSHNWKIVRQCSALLRGRGRWQDLPHQWKVAQEDAESQTIQGYSFKGSRIVTSAEDAPNLTTTFSQWYSDQLKLFGAIERSGPEKSYTVRIQQLEFGEPDHALFEIPADYRVVDIEMPQP